MNELEVELNWLTFFFTSAIIYQALGMISKNVLTLSLSALSYMMVFFVGIYVNQYYPKLEFKIKNVLWGAFIATILSSLLLVWGV